MSVTYQAMFPDNDGLFRRVIAGSGTAFSVVAYLTRSQGYAATLRLSRIVGCTDDDKPSLESVRRLDVGEIISKGHMTFVLKRFFLSWASVEDGNIVNDPKCLMNGRAHTEQSDQPQNLPIDSLLSAYAMLGTMSSDGIASMAISVRVMAAKRN